MCKKNVVEPTCRSRGVNLCTGVWLKAQCLRVEGRKADKFVVKGMLSAVGNGVNDKREMRSYKNSVSAECRKLPSLKLHDKVCNCNAIYYEANK